MAMQQRKGQTLFRTIPNPGDICADNDASSTVCTVSASTTVANTSTTSSSTTNSSASTSTIQLVVPEATQ